MLLLVCTAFVDYLGGIPLNPIFMSLPLVLPPYRLNATASVQTTIVTNYTTADVVFYDGNTQVYSVTLTQQSFFVTLPPGLEVGTFVIGSGTLMMQMPGQFLTTQPGMITLNCTYTDVDVPEPQPFSAYIATWYINE